MNKQLIKGNFIAKDALDIIEQMISIKIKYHESQIGKASNEEDIKSREAKIIQLQNDLSEIRKFIETAGEKISIQSTLHLSS